ncbi:PH domain-containing protein [Leuconostoc gasicomitatum]|uniref:YdbS-like PH domain-containing protein n=1 Tax=Leuconostoc gasicomitatum TaxID=115778 RepID=A0ABM9V2G2_9LACO|nr:PH domain-containing protein [Leuconostoc gasicomitatum]MBZ5954353.1 PH domain-containing protein [Leuconostoc gasicomitatum]MBZ5969618.1 PH domain-containing protein [Leuconostoc gasicomitatum]MBZ5973512.1 PH domain-containing protein [Leuconostoc gasicomitatum]CUW09206.1 Hypothetical protein, ydbT homolog [Leuconostoc gasicomitatum]
MTDRQRQPKIAILSESIGVIRMIIFPAFLIFFKGENNWQIKLLVVAGILALSVVFGILKWWCSTYEITPHEITLTQGIFVKKRAHIPFERVQTITRTQPIYFQPFEVFKVSIETSGKNDDKLEFKALLLPQIEAIEALRKQAQTKITEGSSIAAALPKVDAQYQINNRDLCLYALTSLGSLGTAGGLFVAMTTLNDFLPNRVQNYLDSWINNQTFEIYAVLLVFVVIIGVLGAFIRLYNRYFQFTISRTGVHLGITHGLLTKQNIQLRISRIQAVHYEQSLLRRLVHLVSVSVLLASSVADKGDKIKQTCIMPVVKENDTTDVLQRFVPKYHFPRPEKAPTVSGASVYQLRYIFMLDCLVLGVAFILYGLVKYMTNMHVPYELLILSLIAVSLFGYSLIATYIKMLDQAVYFDDDYLVIQTSLNFTKHTYFIPREKIQGFKTSQSWFMINKNIQHFSVFVRDSDSAQHVTLRYLKQSAIQEIGNWATRVK